MEGIPSADQYVTLGGRVIEGSLEGVAELSTLNVSVRMVGGESSVAVAVLGSMKHRANHTI